jgi:hypothetical protein
VQVIEIAPVTSVQTVQTGNCTQKIPLSTTSDTTAFSWRGLTSATTTTTENAYLIHDHTITAWAFCLTDEEWEKRQAELRESLVREASPENEQ